MVSKTWGMDNYLKGHSIGYCRGSFSNRELPSLALPLLTLGLLNEANENVYWRADWLVHRLATKVHSYYWLDGYSGKDSFSRYWRSEWRSGPNPWRQGLQIPGSDVVIEGNCARVVNQKNKENPMACGIQVLSLHCAIVAG